MNELGGKELLAAKYRVAREWAAKGAAFDGHDRALVPDQWHAEPDAAADGGA